MKKSTRMRVKIKIYRRTLSSRTFITSSRSTSFLNDTRRNENCLPEKFNEHCTLDRVPITTAITKKKFHIHEIIIS